MLFKEYRKPTLTCPVAPDYSWDCNVKIGTALCDDQLHGLRNMQIVYVCGVGMTRFGRSKNNLVKLFCEAAYNALSCSLIQDIDALYVSVMNPEEFTGEGNIAARIAEALGMRSVPAFRVETASSSGAAALHAAVHAVGGGYYRNVLVLGGEKMAHLSTTVSTRILSEVIDRRERLCGATMPALAAMVTEMYRTKHRLSRSRLEQALSRVAIKNHFNGSQNPCAHFQMPITEETYFSSKVVSTPLRLYDCAPISDGAAAVILSSEKTDLMISGIGQGTGPLSLSGRKCVTSFPATKIAAKKAYAMSGICPARIDFAEVHDAFTTFEIISTEDLDFFPTGTAWRAVAEGTTKIDGALPINPSGGLKSRGHPVGATGVAQIVEIVRRLRGEVKVNFNHEPRRALAQSIGGLGANNFVTIVERSEWSSRMKPSWISCEPVATRRDNPVRPTNLEPLGGNDRIGKIEAFTVLYITPVGNRTPLALALVRNRCGHLFIAKSEGFKHLKIGREVYLREVDETYFFTVRHRFKTIVESFQRLKSFISTRLLKITHA